MPVCKNCLKLKDESEFRAAPTRSGIGAVCGECQRKANAKRNKAYRDKNKASINKRLAERRAEKKGGVG